MDTGDFVNYLLRQYREKGKRTMPANLKIEVPAQAEVDKLKADALAVAEKYKQTAGSLQFLREAIDAPDRSEVGEMVEKKIQEYKCIHEIVLKTPEGDIKLDGSPKHFMFEDILKVVNSGLPAALIGPAGSGKSTACEQVAKALEMKYYMQNSVTGEHQLTGYMDAYGKYHTTPFRTAYEKGGLLFVDEVDTSDAAALKWLNTAIANGYAVFPDKEDPVLRHKDFRIVIAANTYGNGADRLYVGANQLDASTLDRFVFFDFRYDELLEKLLAGDVEWVKRVQKLRKAAFEEKARIVISPRASIHGAKLLKMGWTKPKVENAVIWKNTDDELRARIEKRAA